MLARVEALPAPTPDAQRFLAAIARRQTDRVPLIELAVDAGTIATLLGEPRDTTANLALRTRQQVRCLHRLGYDVVKISAAIPWQVNRLSAAGHHDTRGWQDTRHGPIDSPAALERFQWPTIEQVDFTALDVAREVLPDGMGLVGFCGGILEFATDLVGLERFMYATYDAPEMIESVCNHIGALLVEVFERYAAVDVVAALWLGDDLGGKNGLLISPDLLEAWVFPWHRRLAETAHRHGRPFLLHSCGRIERVLPTLIDTVAIDGKHSFEDSIQPVEAFADAWGDRVAVLGGLDMNLLARGTPASVAQRTRQILEHLAPRGGYLAGSGNSITDYIPAENYLTMVETVAQFNERG